MVVAYPLTQDRFRFETYLIGYVFTWTQLKIKIVDSGCLKIVLIH